MAPECKTTAEGGDLWCAKGPRHCGQCVSLCSKCGGSAYEGRATWWVELCECHIPDFLKLANRKLSHLQEYGVRTVAQVDDGNIKVYQRCYCEKKDCILNE